MIELQPLNISIPPTKHNWLNQHVRVTLTYKQTALRISMEPIYFKDLEIYTIMNKARKLFFFYMHAKASNSKKNKRVISFNV